MVLLRAKVRTKKTRKEFNELGAAKEISTLHKEFCNEKCFLKLHQKVKTRQIEVSLFIGKRLT